MDRNLRLQSRCEILLINSIPYRWTSAVAVLGVGGMIRFGYPFPEHQLLPFETATLILFSFTILIYQYDSIALTGNPLKDLPNAWKNKRILFFSFFTTLACCALSIVALPPHLHQEMIVGLFLVTLYFLPLKWIRFFLDQVHLIRWAFLTALIGGAGVIIAGTTESLPNALPLVAPLIIGNLMVCDFRDSQVDRIDPKRNELSTAIHVLQKQLLFLFTLTIGIVILIYQWHEISPEYWILGHLMGFAMLWFACHQRAQPWKVTLLADTALFVPCPVLLLT